MARIGLNHRLSVSELLREDTRALYGGVFEAAISSPRRSIDVFTFDNGSGIGVFYVAPSEALTPAQHLAAIWLEFEVNDERATVAALERLGIRPFEYFDKQHKYFRAPGGQVFRLAAVGGP
jgi:hypothetical protein